MPWPNVYALSNVKLYVQQLKYIPYTVSSRMQCMRSFKNKTKQKMCAPVRLLRNARSKWSKKEIATKKNGKALTMKENRICIAGSFYASQYKTFFAFQINLNAWISSTMRQLCIFHSSIFLSPSLLLDKRDELQMQQQQQQQRAHRIVICGDIHYTE